MKVEEGTLVHLRSSKTAMLLGATKFVHDGVSRAYALLHVMNTLGPIIIYWCDDTTDIYVVLVDKKIKADPVG